MNLLINNGTTLKAEFVNTTLKEIPDFDVLMEGTVDSDAFREQPKRPIPPLIHSCWGVIYPFKLKMPLHRVDDSESVSGILLSGCTSVASAEVINHYFQTGQLDGNKEYKINRSGTTKIKEYCDTSVLSKEKMCPLAAVAKTFNYKNHLDYYNYYIIGSSNFWGRKFDNDTGEYVPTDERLCDITDFLFNTSLAISTLIGASNTSLGTVGTTNTARNKINAIFSTRGNDIYGFNSFSPACDSERSMNFLELEEILYKVAEQRCVSLSGGYGSQNSGHEYTASGFDLGMVFVHMGFSGRFSGFKNITRHGMHIPVGNTNISYNNGVYPHTDYCPIYPTKSEYNNVSDFIKSIPLRDYASSEDGILKPDITFNEFTLTNGNKVSGELINGYAGVKQGISVKIKNKNADKGLVLSDYTIFNFIKLATAEGESNQTVVTQKIKLELKPLEEVICNFVFTAPSNPGKFRITYPWNTALNKDINTVSLGSVSRPTMGFSNIQNVSYTTVDSNGNTIYNIWGDRISFLIQASRKNFNTLARIGIWTLYEGAEDAYERQIDGKPEYNKDNSYSGKENYKNAEGEIIREGFIERGAYNRSNHLCKILKGDGGRSNVSFFDNTIPYGEVFRLKMTRDGVFAADVLTRIQKLRAVLYYTRNSEIVIPGETIETVVDGATTYSVDENTCYNNINITIPATALAVDFSKIKSSLNIDNINLSAVNNPNVIFYVNDRPTQNALRLKLLSEGRNVVVLNSIEGDVSGVVMRDPRYWTANTIRINSNYDFYTPFTFNANKVYFDVKFDEGSSKDGIKYKGIPFIFNVSKVECEGNEINWFGSNIENNNRCFWVKLLQEIYSDSYNKLMSKNFACSFIEAPEIKQYCNYFIAVPGQYYGKHSLLGKTLTFYGENLTLHGSLYIDDIPYKINNDFKVERTYRTGQSGQEASFSVYDAENFKQITSVLDECGTTHLRNEKNIYKLSSDGSGFIHYDDATEIKPFETYFKDFNRRPYIDEDLVES